jgi:hydroxypyruvate isomerase
MRRREFLPALALSTAAAQTPAPAASTGRLKQCVTRGVFGRGMSFEDTCREAARAGAKGYDLIGPNDWPTLKKYGLIPTMYPPGPGGTISDGINRKESHDALEKAHACRHRRERREWSPEHYRLVRNTERNAGRGRRGQLRGVFQPR